MKVRLKDVIYAIGDTTADTEFYYSISDEKIFKAGATEAIGLEDNIPLPKDKEINNYGIMRYFAYSIEDMDKQDKLLASIRGQGAFKHFRETVAELSLKGKWQKYRDSEYEGMARDWCMNNDIHVVE